MAIEEQKCENCKYYDAQEKCCLCRNKSWYEPNDEIKIEELEKQNANLQIMLQAEREVRCNNEYLKRVTELEHQVEQAKEECEQLQEKYLSESYEKAKLVSKIEKAKEIIKTFCGLYSVFNSSNGSFDNFIAKAEQFLGD